MAPDADPQPGRPRKDLSGQIVDLLETTDHRAMTLGMIARSDEVDGARATVKDRLDRLVERGTIQTDKIGNATAYYILEEPTPTAAAYGGGGNGGAVDGEGEERTPTKNTEVATDLPGFLLAAMCAVVLGPGFFTIYKASLLKAAAADRIMVDGNINARVLLTLVGGLGLYAATAWAAIELGLVNGILALGLAWSVLLGVAYVVVLALPHAVLCAQAAGWLTRGAFSAAHRIRGAV